MPTNDVPCKRCGQSFSYCDDPGPSCLKCVDLAAENVGSPGYIAIDVRSLYFFAFTTYISCSLGPAPVCRMWGILSCFERILRKMQGTHGGICRFIINI